MSSNEASFPVLEAKDLDHVEQYLKTNEFFWLDLHDPDADALRRVGDLLHLHPLTIQDVSTFSERPKREHFDGYISLVVYGVDEHAAEGEELLREVHMLISGQWVVTLHPTPFAVIGDLLGRVRLEPHHREQALIFEILDTIMSSYIPVLNRIDDAIDDVEQVQCVIDKPREESLQRIFSLKRDLISMRRVVTPMRDFARPRRRRNLAPPGNGAG